MLVHLTPQEMTWQERKHYISGETLQQRHQNRRARQKANKRKSHQQQDDQDDDFWGTFWRQDQRPSSSSAQTQWRPRYR